MHHAISRTGPARGLTLIELMVVVVVVAILSAIAYPSFTQAIRKGRRADGVAALTTIQQAQERWRANHTAYTATAADLNITSLISPDGHYDLSIAVDASGTGYSVTAAARGNQQNDTQCRYLRVSMPTGSGNLLYESSADGSAWAAPANNPCWSK